MKTTNARKMIERAGAQLETDPRYHNGLIARFGYHNIEMTDQDGKIIAIKVTPAHEKPDSVSDYYPGTYLPSLTQAINYVLSRKEQKEDRLVLTADQIELMATERSICTDWGWIVYTKERGASAWNLAYLLMPENSKRRTIKVYPDLRPSEIILWAEEIGADQGAQAIQAELVPAPDAEPVDLIASGYEWTCPDPNCEHYNREIEITPAVKCDRCGTVYATGEARDAIG